jgi:hypothetical protein
MTTTQPEGRLMPTIFEYLKEVCRTAVAFVRFLRSMVAARVSVSLGDERGEIASWVVVTALVVVAAIAIVGIVVTKLTTTAHNIQTP